MSNSASHSELKFLLDENVAKSKLTMKDAMGLGTKVNEGMLKELRDKGLV